jgi:hypothetical protein
MKKFVIANSSLPLRFPFLHWCILAIVFKLKMLNDIALGAIACYLGLLTLLWFARLFTDTRMDVPGFGGDRAG